ncbi:hypothetical protein PPRY_a1127 [Pseudoalteromonas prydzensis ACAM 620]|nr:hypothetical protein [Pseudoalteromonas prydzensis ACAM 620]
MYPASPFTLSTANLTRYEQKYLLDLISYFSFNARNSRKAFIK